MKICRLMYCVLTLAVSLMAPCMNSYALSPPKPPDVVDLTIESDTVVICSGTRSVDIEGKTVHRLYITKVLRGSQALLGRTVRQNELSFHGDVGTGTEGVYWGDSTLSGMKTYDNKRNGTNYTEIKDRIDPTIRVLADLKHAAHAPIKPLESYVLYNWIRLNWFSHYGDRYWGEIRNPEPDSPLSRAEVADFLKRLAQEALDGWKNTPSEVFNDPYGGHYSYYPHTENVLDMLAEFKDPSSSNLFYETAMRGNFSMAAKGLIAVKHPNATSLLCMALDLPMLNCLQPLPYDVYAKGDVLEVLSNVAGEEVTEEALDAFYVNRSDGIFTTNEKLGHYLRGVDDYNNRVGYALCELKDSIAVPALLRSLWRGDINCFNLAYYNDPRIKEDALSRMYSHPDAPSLLAETGDPDARAFMIKLITQGFREGITWAVKTGDPEARSCIADNFAELSNIHAPMVKTPTDCTDTDFVNFISSRDMRAGRYFSPSEDELERLFLIAGVNGGDQSGEKPCRKDIIRGLLESAGPEELGLSKKVRIWLEESMEIRQPGESIAQLPYPYIWESGRISGNRMAVKEALDKETGVILQVLLDPRTHPEDIQRVLRTAQAEGLFRDDKLLSRRHIHSLIMRSDVGLSDEIYRILRERELTLDKEEMYALIKNPCPGNFLHYAIQYPSDIPPKLIAEIFNRDSLLSRDDLFAALRAVKPDGVLPRLKSLLVENHMNVRRNAALTLAAYGDASGLDVLRMEYERLSCGSSRYGNGDLNEVKQALESLHALN